MNVIMYSKSDRMTQAVTTLLIKESPILFMRIFYLLIACKACNSECEVSCMMSRVLNWT